MDLSSPQKVKLLAIMDYLRTETDENNPVSRQELCAKLNEMGISSNVRTLSLDIETLIDAGYEIMKDHKRYYYVEDRAFSVPELKILIDAVQAATFVTDRKADELVDKISALGGRHRASILKDNIVHFNTRKHSNEAIYYNVDSIETAIRKNKKITFRYFDVNENGERVYRKEGEEYMSDPVALVFDDDNYYLICYTEKYEATTNYRVDRMDSVTVTKTAVCPETKKLRRTVGKYTESVFKMYGGETTEVTLRFDRSLIGPVLDKFGEGVPMTADVDTCSATVDVQVSPTFFGWLAQFGGKMKIAEPESVIEQYKGHISEIQTGV